MLAFGFVNAAILGWLAAAAAPILIHLWMKRVRRETEWAAVRFLRKAIERHSRKLKLREWLLLAIRTAIILCVVLAAAKPVLEGLGLAGPGVRTHYLLVVDASLSMRYQTDDGTLLEGAKGLVAKLIESGRSGDVYSLVVMTDTPRAVVAQPTSDAGRVRRAVESIEPTDGGANLESTLAVAKQLLDRSQTQTEHVDRHEIVMFTDLAKHTWNVVAENGDNAAQTVVGQSLQALSEQAEISVVDLGEVGAANTAVTRLAFAKPLPTANRPLQITATVRRFVPVSNPTNNADPQTAELLVNGVSVASKPYTPPTTSTATVVFTHRFERPGANAIEVRIGEDRLPADNAGWLGTTLPARTRVLCVAGAPGAARFVANALRPSGDKADQPIEPVIVSDAELAIVELSQFAAVFLCNVAQISRQEAERLAAYVRDGGGVTFFLGDRVLPEAYNQILAGGAGQGGVGRWMEGAAEPLRLVADTKPSSPLLPATLGAPTDAKSYVIDPLDYAHPVIEPFAGRERSGLLNTPIARYWHLSLADNANDAQVGLATANGDPLLITSSLGRGRVAVFATAASLGSVDSTTGDPWTIMPAWPSFLPIVRGLLNYTAGAGGEVQSSVVGEVLRGGGTGLQEVEIERPDGRVASVLPEDRGAWTYSNADQAGVYLVRRPGELDALAAIDVNIAAAESDLSRVSASALPSTIRVRRVATRSSAADALPASTGIHRLLLLAALGLVLLETALAYWWGRSLA